MSKISKISKISDIFDIFENIAIFSIPAFKLKMYQHRFRPGLCPDPSGGAYDLTPDSVIGREGNPLPIPILFDAFAGPKKPLFVSRRTSCYRRRTTCSVREDKACPPSLSKW